MPSISDKITTIKLQKQSKIFKHKEKPHVKYNLSKEYIELFKEITGKEENNIFQMSKNQLIDSILEFYGIISRDMRDHVRKILENINNSKLS